MGALGLLLGTVGLAIVLSRSIVERKQEIALMRAIGLSKSYIRKMIVEEYMILLGTGVCIGFVTAVIATLPSVVNPETGVSITGICLIFLLLLLSGWIFTRAIAMQTLKNNNLYESLRND